MDKNSILLLILLLLFTLDVVKVKYFPDAIEEVTSTRASTEATTETNLETLTEDDLKLDDTGDVKNNDKVEVSEAIKEQGIKNLIIEIRHCTSNESKANDLKKDLLSQISDADVQLSIYPTTQLKAYISKGLSFLQFGLFIIFMGGQALRNSLTFIPPAVFDFIEKRKMLIGIGMYFGISQLQSVLSKTGAFEVYANNELVWSKLGSNQMPTIESILITLNEMGLVN